MTKTRVSRFARCAFVLLSVAGLAFCSLPAQAAEGKADKAKTAEKAEKKVAKAGKKKASAAKKKKKADTGKKTKKVKKAKKAKKADAGKKAKKAEKADTGKKVKKTEKTDADKKAEKADADKKVEKSEKADADKKKAEAEDGTKAKDADNTEDAVDLFGDGKPAKKDADEKKDEVSLEEPASEEKETTPPPAEKKDVEPAEEDKAREAADADIEEDVDLEVLSSSDSKEKKGFFPTEFDGDGAVRRDRGINILTARATRPMALTLVIDHRPYTELAGGEAEDVFFDYLGLDGSNLKVGLGLRFGIIEGLDVGLYRLNDGKTVNFDAYEFDVRYAFLKQEKHFIDMSARAGISWFAKKNADDGVGGYGEIFIDRVFFDMLLVGAGFQIHSHGHNDVKQGKDDSFSGAVLGVIEWRMIKQLAITAEIAAAVAGYGADYGSEKRPSFPSFSMGLKVLTRRHTFTFLVSNSQFINADGIVSNSWRDFSDIIFGFQIFREFNFK